MLSRKRKRTMKIKLTWKIWLWIVFFIFALISIFVTPNFLQKGVLVKEVNFNSSAFNEGIKVGEVIVGINGEEVNNLDDFLRLIPEQIPSSEKIKTTITTSTTEYVIFSSEPLGISVSNIPKHNLKLGLDLAGGSRAFIEAEDHKLTKQEVEDLAKIIENRLNVFGVSDMKIIPTSDLFGNNRLSIEIAGATPKVIKELISQQGKFEAKIGNDTVFIGGEKDITSVVRSGQESGIYSCAQSQNGYACEFRFVVYLSQSAAERHANITNTLEVNSTAQGNYLSKRLDLYLDDTLVDSLLISENLKGSITTQIQISGSGSGATKEDAYKSAEENMKKLQTVLITGSLPFKLKVVKFDTISPTLGSNFTKYLFLAGGVALILVAITVFARYRTKSAIAPLIVCTSEIIITLGVTAFMKWDLDLMAIAGILAAIGTGVDDQIVVLDEANQKGTSISLKQKIKNAFVIVLGAYFTSVASLLPLAWVGGGLLKGFVLTTVTGITLGVLITRPAFADLVRLFEKENAS
jgi:preprotein translocase subunit SecD